MEASGGGLITVKASTKGVQGWNGSIAWGGIKSIKVCGWSSSGVIVLIFNFQKSGGIHYDFVQKLPPNLLIPSTDIWSARL